MMWEAWVVRSLYCMLLADALLNSTADLLQSKILHSMVGMLRYEVVVMRLIETLTQSLEFVGQKALNFRLRDT